MITFYFKDLLTSGAPYHIAETVLKDDSQTTAHNHDFCEFFIINQGSLTCNINGKNFEMSEKCLCFNMPDDIHFFRKNKFSQDVIFTNVAFEKELFDEIIQLFVKEFSVFDYKPLRGIIYLSDEKYHIFTNKIKVLNDMPRDNKQASKTLFLKSTLIDLLILYLKDDNVNNPENASVPLWLLTACKEMEKHENNIVGIRRFIELSNKTHEHLIRVMKKYYGLTPTCYINNLRLQEAARHLAISEKKITDIIYEAGFNNLSHFNDLFKKKYGLTASSYRKVNRRIINPDL